MLFPPNVVNDTSASLLTFVVVIRGWKRVVVMSKGLVMVMVMVLVLVLNLVFAQENLHFQCLIVTFHLVT